uniref:Uncharacterized protein n=1 Tax=Phytophthora ramorum TaxID=164328 RepID=H3GGI6_PHYRM
MAKPKCSSRRVSPPKTDNNADPSAPSPPPQPPAATVGATRGWRPTPGGGRHDSPLYGSHRKRPPSSSATATIQEQYTAAPAPPLSLSLAGDASASVQPPRTPQGRATKQDAGLSAAQRVRLELSTHTTSRAGSGSRANSSEDVFASRSPVFDEDKNGPRSCPTTFNGDGATTTRFSPGRRRRGGELMVSKLLPTRDSVNSLLTYVHELQVSEASLRKQFLSTKRDTEVELHQSVSKVNELERAMQERERDRQLDHQRLEEKDRRIRELAAKLEQAEARRASSSSVRDSVFSGNGLPPIAEEVHARAKSRKIAASPQATKVLEPPPGKVPALTLDALHLSTQDAPAPPLRPSHLQRINDQSTQFELASPRSPNRPLWDPWASGGATPMKNLPPVFTMGSTGLDPVVASPSSTAQTSMAHPTANAAEDYELKSVLMSPRRAQGQIEVFENGNAPQHIGQDAYTPSPPIQLEKGPTALPAQDPIEKAPPQVVAPPYNGRVPSTEADQVSNPDAYNAAANVGSAPPVGTSVPPPSTSEAQPPPCPASATQKDAKPAPAEPVTLEALLVDFFTEVDKKRLKMAKAYGKRYAGREKWLFAELTKRYGAAKVGALKARFENGSTGGAPTTTTTSSSNGDAAAVTDTDTDNHATKAPETSDHSKTGRQGHPRHPQFFHPPAPAANVDLSAGMSSVPPPLTTPQANDASDSQTEGAEGPPSLSGNASPGRAARVSPRQRRSGGNIPPYSGPPPSFPLPQEANEGNNVGAVAAGTPLTNASPAPTQRDESMSQPPPPPSGMDNNNTASLGLRQRHNSSGPGAPRQKNTDAEAPAVTLEGLLKELYKKHQPDKLKNAPIVAKQYAGKERELVGLLKGKYGALSVKRLEENVEVLERAHRARTGGKSSGKKRGCFVRTISLVFWLSVLLYFSFGAVFVSFVVLDAWGCRSDEQEAESSEECLPLKNELETFTYEHVGDYVSQSHPDACFCLEWKARETALLTNLSGDDFVNLARLVPFSPESYGDPWIATVKEQVPSQEFYDSYAKPVVDLSLDVGFFVWSSALELAGTSCEEEEENESFLSEMNVDELLNQDTDAKADAVVDAPEQALVEEESEKLADEVEIEEVDAATQDGASVAENDEDAVVLVEVEEATPTEDSNSASSEIKNEEHATLDESVEGVLPVDESESVEVSEDDSAVLKETDTETKEVLFEDDSVSFPVEDVESVGDENDGPTSSPEDVTETPDADNSVDVTDEVPGQVEEEDAEKVAASIEEESDVESEEVVEVEVRQEGLDLTYPETEADADATEVQETDVVEVPSLASDEDLESTLSAR